MRRQELLKKEAETEYQNALKYKQLCKELEKEQKRVTSKLENDINRMRRIIGNGTTIPDHFKALSFLQTVK